MCDICRRTLCPAGCPNHARGARESGETCFECGAVISRGAMLYRFGLDAVCEECADALDMEGILRLSGVGDRADLLRAVGAERERAE